MDSVSTSPWIQAACYVGFITQQSAATGTKLTVTYTFEGRSVSNLAEVIQVKNIINHANPFPTAEVTSARIGSPAMLWPTRIANEPYHLWAEYEVIEEEC